MKLDRRIERLEARRQVKRTGESEWVSLSEEEKQASLARLRERLEQVSREHEEREKLPLEEQLIIARRELKEACEDLEEHEKSPNRPWKKGDTSLGLKQVKKVFAEHLVRDLEEKIKYSSVQPPEG